MRKLMDISWVYKQSDEVNPREAERKAMIERLTAIQYVQVPETPPQDSEENARRERQIEEQLRRSCRMHAQRAE